MSNLRRGTAPISSTAVTQIDRISDRDHFVQFYHHEETLLESIVRYFAVGFAQGNPAILIATPQHRAAVESRLGQMGINLQGLKRTGAYSAFDARDLLAHFMIGDMPDASLFRASLGAALDASLVEWKGVRVFGEMATALHSDGNEAGAVQLEHLWNDLGKIFEFTLFCAYPSRQFADRRKTERLSHICAAHSRVIGAC